MYKDDFNDMEKNDYEEKESIHRDNLYDEEGEEIKYSTYESEGNNKKNKKEKKTRKKEGKSSYFLVALVAAIIGGIVSQLFTPLIMPVFSKNPGDNIENPGILVSSSGDLNVVSAVAKSNMKSVVGITTVEIVSDYYFFLPREVEGVGSGVIVNSNGYILTNSHVVRDGKAKSLEVLFEDGEKVPGKVLWSDQNLDLAIVKVDKTGLPAVKLGDSDRLEVGEIAIAIGNPLGLEFQRSVTAGVVSGLNRTISVENITMNDLIQTDASINRGNSGGPLFNHKGEVIGINTVKVGNAEGLGFSIPINSAKYIINEVVNTGHYEPVTLGIRGLNPDEFSAAFNIENSDLKNLIVIEVLPGSPAEAAGIQQFDIIKKINGVEIRTREDIGKELHKFKNGDKIKLTLIRDNREMEVELKFK